MNRLYCHLLLAAAALNQVSLCLADAPAPTASQGVYAVNGRLHVNLFGAPEGEPITTGSGDMKPSWSKTGNRIVFFRLAKYTPDIRNWKTAICVVNADGSNFRKLTTGTHGDFNPTWTRDGSNVIYFSRRDADTGRYIVHRTTADANPGDEVSVSDPARNTFSVSSLKDGRLFVTSWGRGIQDYCFLLTPGAEGSAKYEPVKFSPPKRGMADRISISPSETKVCYDFQKGFGMNQYPGRTIYIADFDVATRTVSSWKTTICVINADGSGFRKLTDGTQTDFNPTWSRDGKNRIYFSRRDPAAGGFAAYMTTADANPGDEVPVGDPTSSSYVLSCLKDGRIFVMGWSQTSRDRYFLLTPAAEGRAKMESVKFAFPLPGLLDRLSVSPSETKVCYELQKGFGAYKYPGRTLYIADFDLATRTVSNPKAITDTEPDPNVLWLYPCWTNDESAVVYYSDKSGKPQLYLYHLVDGSTIRVSTNPNTTDKHPCAEATPK